MRVDGKPVSPVTVWRWARHGKGGVKLAVFPRGRKLATTHEAVHEFERKVAEADRARWADRCGDAAPDPRAQDVEAEAAKLGI